MRVRDLMRRKSEAVVTVEPSTRLEDVVRLLLHHGIGGVPVVDDDGRVLGFVSERNIVEALDRHGRDAQSVAASRIMQKPPICAPDDLLSPVMGRMTRERLRHLVIVDDGRAAGILSVGDIVKHRLEELELETGVLRDYVAGQRAGV